MSLQKSKWFLSLRAQIWIGSILIFTPIFIGCFFWFNTFAKASVLNVITTYLGTTVDGVLDGINTDDFVKLAAESKKDPNCIKDSHGYYPENNPLYMEHENWLRTVQKIQPNTEIYTYIKGSKPGEVIGIGSTGYFHTPQYGFKFCNYYTSQKTEIYAGLTSRTDSWEIYPDPYGKWITTYMPIKDHQGQIIGAVGVDIKAGYIEEVGDAIVKLGTVAFIISYVIIFILIYLLSGILTKTIINLSHIATDVANGEYEQNWAEILANRPLKDEIDTLISVFKSMVEKVAEREQNLRDRVQQLEIIIDRSKLDQQVTEIVDSDFFQDLQSKVKNMRSRFKDTDQPNTEQ